MVMVLFLSILGSWVSLGGGYSTAPEVTVVEADGDHAVIQLDLSGYNLEQFSSYSRLNVAEHGWNMDTPVGNPELPMISVVVGIPAGATPSVSLVNADWVSAGTGTPYPVQPLRTDNDIEPFFFVDISTDLHGVYPLNTVNLFQQGNWAGVNTVVLQMNPFTWNASTCEFKVASSMTARIDFHGDRGYQVSVRPEVANMHRSRIVNYDALNVVVDSSPVSMDDNVYICVVPPENLESITPLLAMVNSLGHHVHVIEVESGTNSYSIKGLISDAYQEGITRFALIPATHAQLESKDYGAFVGDYYYELMSSDNYPDLAVGRFSGNFNQLENQTVKTMSYITYQGVEGQPSLPASVILAAHQEQYPGKYTANSESVRTWDYALADIVFETVYPPEGGTPGDVSTAINNGVGIVNYRGHGSNTTWQWQGNWSAGNVYALTNTYFPLVFNVCCNNGNHKMTYNCLSETWLDAPGGVGASGNLGASAPSLTIVNNRMQRVLFWEIFDEGNTCAGEMFTATQTDIIQTHGGGGVSNSRMYHWFGDPSMDIPNSDLSGAPFALDFDVPTTLNTGSNTLHITITSGGSPVEGVVVTITDGVGNHSSYTESFYEQQITNGSGEVWLNFTALEGKDLYYGARLHNYASVTGTIDMISEGIESGESFTAELFPVTPSPVSGTANISFTTPVSAHVNISVLDIAGRVVSTVQDGQLQAGAGLKTLDASELVPGVYFVIMQTADTTITRKMAVVR
ncbi:MAG: T9SS type A sorting domain-containing protein [Candidatus Sabulitectum sp.]|nr:T9SS type A sorting domain-containing protein [Candidatus Sabulitectum sp.]